MTQEEKLKELRNHVEKLGLKYSRTKFPKLHTCHLFVLPYKIAVHICGEKDDEFRKKYKKRIFIHDDISVDDIIHDFDELASKLNYLMGLGSYFELCHIFQRFPNSAR